MPTAALVAVVLVVLSGGAWAWRTHQGAAPDLNLGFETAGAFMDRPAEWRTDGDGYEIVLDTATPFAGSRSLRIRSSAVESAKSGVASSEVPAFGFSAGEAPEFRVAGGVASNAVPVHAPFGKKARLRGYVRTNGITEGYAGLWLRSDGDGRVLKWEYMQSHGATGTTPWTAYEVTLPLHSAAIRVVFGVLLTDNGTAWFDSLTLSVDGKTWAEVAKPLAPSVDELSWVRRNAIPLENVDAVAPTGDLRPLRTMLRDARIVALAEGTHGTSEFFRMKHRLTEFLATTQGFTVFAVEANTPEARRVNDYVLTGRGDPTALLAGCTSGPGTRAKCLR